MGKQRKWFWSVSAVTALAAPAARGGGFDLPDQDAFAVGRGMAVVATADNPSAIYFNPAGITQLKGNNFRGGIYGVYLEPAYEPRSPGTGKFYNEDKLHAIPQLYYTYGPQNGPLTYGIGLYSPFGLSLRWPENTGFRTVGTQSSVTYMSLNPVVGLEILPHFSLGAGISVNYAEADLKRGLFSTTDSDYFRFKGDGWGVSGNLGLLWKLHEKVVLGASLRVPSSINLDGRTEFASTSPPVIPPQRMDAQADFAFPIKVVAGISFRPTPNWNIEFDADYTDWSALGTVTIRQSAAVAPLPKDLPLVLNWEGSWYYEFGITRYLPKGWLVSAGYIFNQNSDPDAHYTPLTADLDRHFLSVGIGHRGTRWDYDIAYQFGYGPSRSVTGSAPSPIGQTADGNYNFISHAVAVSVGLHF